MGRIRFVAGVGTVLVLVLGTAQLAGADKVGPYGFEACQIGDINGQQGWTKTNPSYDASVVAVSGYPAAAGYAFGAQALRISDAYTSGAFGDQTFSPGVINPAGETTAVNAGFGTGPRQRSFVAKFRIGTALATQQPGLHMSVSPDRGDGARMSYLRFEDQADGVHVLFDDVTDPGPIGTTANFNESDIATLDRAHAHTIAFVMLFREGPGNDRVTIRIDGVVRKVGTSWENYYRYDPEQAGSGNTLPTVDKLLFRESGTANPADSGNGFLINNVLVATPH